MKKLFSAFTAVLLAFCFISCAPQEFSGSSSKNNGSVSVSLNAARTISPASGVSYLDVSEWTLTFQDITVSREEKYNNITQTVSFENNKNIEIPLPTGTYKIILEGSATKSESSDNPVEVPFYGEDSVTVEKNQTVYKSVCVAPKKSDGGKGSFNFTVNISGLEKSAGLSPLFECHLIPYGETSQEPLIKSTLNEELTTLTITATDISSGLYKLSIVCSWIKSDSYNGQVPESKEIFYPYHDFLVEIIDGLTTTGSADITVSLEESKTYYATTGTSKGNGAFASMPKNFDALLEEIDRTTISTANIIIVDSLAADGTTIYPEIDVSKVNATGVCYNISVITSKGKVTHCYSIKDEDGDGNPTINTEVGIIKLKDSSAAGKTVDVYNNSDISLKELLLSLKNNTSVVIKFEVKGLVILDEIDSFDYYSTHPFMTAESKISDLYLSLTLAESYTTASKTISDSKYEYYILPAVQEDPTINGFAYDLVATKNDLSVKDTPLYVGDTVTITAISKSEDGSFINGTTFVWFINGKRTDCTDQSYTIKFGDGDAVAENTIICLVGYNKEYSTKSIVLTAQENIIVQENTIVLYNNTSDTGKPALSYATLTENSILSPTVLLAKDSSTEIVDYCFDALNNLYAIVNNTADTTPYSINKYTYKNGYSKDNVTKYTTIDENVYSINYIEASDAGDLYAVIYANDNGEYAEYIAKLTLKEPTEGETAGTITFDKYISPISWTENGKSYTIYTFCTDGTNLYTITSISTWDESGIETAATIELAKNSINGNQLLKVSEITLDSYTDGGQSSPTDVFLGYGDNLEYKDLCYINDKLYLIVRDVEVSYYSNDSVLYSRGALCTFTVSDAGITAGEIRIGYQTEPSIISYTISTSGQAIERTAYIGDIDSKLFYGPVKFIARKEGELLIADNGYCVDSSNVNTKNNIVKVNLNAESASIDSFIPLESGYFDYAYSGQFGTSNGQ